MPLWDRRGEPVRASRTRRAVGLLVGGTLFWAAFPSAGPCVAAAAQMLNNNGTVPLGTFLDQVAGAQGLAAACARSAEACVATSLPGPEQVVGQASGSFRVDWEWLRSSLAAARPAASGERQKQMEAAAAHLTELAAEARGPERLSSDTFRKARTAANAALVRDEFRAAEGPSWFDRQVARVQDWFLQLFTGMDRLGQRAPWLAPAIEWACFGMAAAGLLWFVRQSLARQALRISLSEGAALGWHGDRDAADWAKLAEERAAARDWREAVHCLYWAAIALMESRRAWRPNPTRTPREYLRLLRPGSASQQALHDLTRGFERIWYGDTMADESQYQAVLTSFRALEAARPERAQAPSDGPDATALPQPGGA